MTHDSHQHDTADEVAYFRTALLARPTLEVVFRRSDNVLVLCGLLGRSEWRLGPAEASELRDVLDRYLAGVEGQS